MNHRPVIIPVASGKGGVGKSFITANLAIALAERGKQVIVIDLDLGGCNLHSFLGLPNRFPGIGDFLQVDGLVLHDLLVPTGITNLMFLPGDGKIPLLANIPFVQKVKLMNEIRKLPANYIFLDLGAGASYNTLDFYGISQFGILVIKPEYTSLMNMLTFLKNYLFRSVFQALSDDEQMQAAFKKIYNQSMSQEIPDIKKLQQIITKKDSKAGAKVSAIIKNCRPRIIFNMGFNPNDSLVAANLSRTLSKILSIEADYFGFVFSDSSVRKSIRQRTVFLPGYRGSMAADNIMRIAVRIDKYWQRPVRDSARLLQNYVQKIYNTRKQRKFLKA